MSSLQELIRCCQVNDARAWRELIAIVESASRYRVRKLLTRSGFDETHDDDVDLHREPNPNLGISRPALLGKRVEPGADRAATQWMLPCSEHGKKPVGPHGGPFSVIRSPVIAARDFPSERDVFLNAYLGGEKRQQPSSPATGPGAEKQAPRFRGQYGFVPFAPPSSTRTSITSSTATSSPATSSLPPKASPNCWTLVLLRCSILNLPFRQSNLWGWVL